MGEGGVVGLNVPFVRVPLSVVRCGALRPAAKVLWAYLAGYVWGEGGAAYPSYGRMGRELRLSRRSVLRAVRELREMGLLRVRRCGRRNLFSLRPPERPFPFQQGLWPKGVEGGGNPVKKAGKRGG